MSLPKSILQLSEDIQQFFQFKSTISKSDSFYLEILKDIGTLSDHTHQLEVLILKVFPYLVDVFNNNIQTIYCSDYDDVSSILESDGLKNLAYCSAILYKFCLSCDIETILQSVPTNPRLLEVVLKFAENLIDDKQTVNVHNAYFKLGKSLCFVLIWLSNLVLIPFPLNRNHYERFFGLIERILHISGAPAARAAFLAGKLCSRQDANVDTNEECLSNFLNFLRVSYKRHSEESAHKEISLKTFKYILKNIDIEKFKPHIPLTEHSATLKNVFHHKYLIASIGRFCLFQALKKPASWLYKKKTVHLLSGEKLERLYETSQDIFPTDVNINLSKLAGYLFQNLLRKENVLRWVAAKSIGRLCRRLPYNLAEQIILQLIQEFKSNDSLYSWHGFCLAIGVLIKNNCIIPSILPEIMDKIYEAIVYEPNHSIDMNLINSIRDAGCFISWSIVNSFEPSILNPYKQTLAEKLLVVAVLDSNLNCRRCASAALQELIGRVGGIPEGDLIISVVNYYNVASLRISLLSLAPQISKISVYRMKLIEQLLMTKLYQTHQTDLREIHGKSLFLITRNSESLDELKPSFDIVIKHVRDVAEKHIEQKDKTSNLIIGLTALLDAADHCKFEITLINEICELPRYIMAMQNNNLFKGSHSDSLRIAICSLITVFSKCLKLSEEYAKEIFQLILSFFRTTTTHVQVAAVEAFRSLCSNQIQLKDCNIHEQVKYYLDSLSKRIREETAFEYRIGSILALAFIEFQNSPLLLEQQRILDLLIEQASLYDNNGNYRTRIAALSVIPIILNTIKNSFTETQFQTKSENIIDNKTFYIPKSMMEVLITAGNDYTYDEQLGSIGNGVRESALEVMTYLWENFDLPLMYKMQFLIMFIYQTMNTCESNRSVYLLHRLLAYCSQKKFSCKFRHDWSYQRTYLNYSYECYPEKVYVNDMIMYLATVMDLPRNVNYRIFTKVNSTFYKLKENLNSEENKIIEPVLIAFNKYFDKILQDISKYKNGDSKQEDKKAIFIASTKDEFEFSIPKEEEELDLKNKETEEADFNDHVESSTIICWKPYFYTTSYSEKLYSSIKFKIYHEFKYFYDSFISLIDYAEYFDAVLSGVINQFSPYSPELDYPTRPFLLHMLEKCNSDLKKKVTSTMVKLISQKPSLDNNLLTNFYKRCQTFKKLELLNVLISRQLIVASTTLSILPTVLNVSNKNKSFSNLRAAIDYAGWVLVFVERSASLVKDILRVGLAHRYPKIRKYTSITLCGKLLIFKFLKRFQDSIDQLDELILLFCRVDWLELPQHSAESTAKDVINQFTAAIQSIEL